MILANMEMKKNAVFAEGEYDSISFLCHNLLVYNRLEKEPLPITGSGSKNNYEKTFTLLWVLERHFLASQGFPSDRQALPGHRGCCVQWCH